MPLRLLSAAGGCQGPALEGTQQAPCLLRLQA